MRPWSLWKNNCHEGTTNPQSRGFKEGPQAYFLTSWSAFQHCIAYALCGLSDAAMLSCHLCMDGWLLRKHSLPLTEAAPLPGVRTTELVIWRREFIVIVIERLSAILSKDDTSDSGRWDGEMGRNKISGRSSSGSFRSLFWNMKCISPMTLMVCDVLHTISLGKRKDLMEWVTFFLEQHARIDKFHRRWAMLPPFSGFARFNKTYN